MKLQHGSQFSTLLSTHLILNFTDSLNG